MNAAATRTLAALWLQLLATAVLLWALADGRWLDARTQAPWWVLVDRSDSMPQEETNTALTNVLRSVSASGGAAPRVLEFAARAVLTAAPSAERSADPSGQPATAPPGAISSSFDPSRTHIEAALLAALAAHARQPLAGVVVVSDGLENEGNAARALLAAQAARLPVRWLAVGKAAPAARITQVLAPERAQLGQQVQLSVQLAGQLARQLRVQATARAADGQTQTAQADVLQASVDGTTGGVPAVGGAAETGTPGSVSLTLQASATGAWVVDLTLQDMATGQVLHRLADAAVLDVQPRAPLLVVQGPLVRAGHSLAHSLQQGGWPLTVVPAARLDTQADALQGLQAVVLDDVAIADASPRFWSALVAAVKDQGLGLLVLGGERSFARGGYRGSALEPVLPVLSEPAALDEPAAVLFAVDKSGSMGQGSGGIDRFAMAQRAVLETARGLQARDTLGLLVFDVVPQMLVPMGPAAAGTAALARDWPASPNGGTQLAPALDKAIAELEQATAPRRLLVLVTDGFVDAAPVAGLRDRLLRARIETVVLAVGPDADVNALQSVVSAGLGQVLRVDQTANLPAVMRAGVERRRARVERGAIAVQQVLPLPFAPATLQAWPPVAAHHATRPQPEAVVAVQTLRGEPVVAYRAVGRGRVAAITSGLGEWTPQWQAWRDWPQLAGGWANWVSGAAANDGSAGFGGLVVTEVDGALRVDVDAPAPAADAVPGVLHVQTPGATQLQLPFNAVAPGRLRAVLPASASASAPAPGLYTFTLNAPQGTLRHLHLQRSVGEHQAFGLNPALATWRASGLISAWQPGPWTPPAAATATAAGGLLDGPAQPVDRSLLLLALGLCAAAVLVDRRALAGAALPAAWRAARRRLQQVWRAMLSVR